MTYAAVQWAYAQRVTKASAKFVLVTLAKMANKDGLCWPSTRLLCADTELDIKTVLAGLQRLREMGLIVDSGKRAGGTGQVIVYRLNTTENGGLSDDENTPENGGVTDPETHPFFPSKTPENGGVQAEGNTPVFPGNTPVFPMKHTRFSQETHPKTVEGKVNGKVNGKVKERVIHDSDLFGGLLADVDAKLLADFLEVRKAKKVGKLTQTAIEGLAREAAKARMSIPDVIRMCCERGWAGFKAEWLVNAQRTGNAPSRHTGFDQQTYEGADDGSIPA